MRIGIIGQKFAAAELFAQLAREHEIEWVAAPTLDDRLANAAIPAGVPVHCYADAGLDALMGAAPVDLLISMHSFEFVPGWLRKRAKWAIGYHPSLLPLRPGRNSIRDTVAGGDRLTGGTVYHLSDRIDGGDIVFQDWCFVPASTDAAGLWRDQLCPMGIELLVKSADHALVYGFLPAEPQASLA